ncbi:hypothetical protein BHE74_00048603 [Ensete ventricosum]|nr:hypothetical protein GW17_00026292 [Ensete ventricosum]RWW45546.1 hypothetical protein BHE74_00048603 [Ensete ventricosum]RZS06410.1 hypothetical protein BHM03_00037060 [Ensete ventricosum]
MRRGSRASEMDDVRTSALVLSRLSRGGKSGVGAARITVTLIRCTPRRGLLHCLGPASSLSPQREEVPTVSSLSLTCMLEL